MDVKKKSWHRKNDALINNLSHWNSEMQIEEKKPSLEVRATFSKQPVVKKPI